MNKYLKIGGIVASSAIILVLVAAFGFKYVASKGTIVYDHGKWYTKEQFRKNVPLYDGTDWSKIPDKNTPEEVYNNFRDAMLKGDVNLALSQIKEQKRMEYKNIFNNKDGILEYKNNLPEFEKIHLNKNQSSENLLSFSYNVQGKDGSFFVIIEKNLDGYWLIDSI